MYGATLDAIYVFTQAYVHVCVCMCVMVRAQLIPACVQACRRREKSERARKINCQLAPHIPL